MSEEETAASRRRRRSRAEADQLAAEFEASGLRREEFCSRVGLSAQTLARYIAQRRREQAVTNPTQRWVAVEIAEPRSEGAELTVVLSRSRRIEVKRGFDGDTLRRLMAVLEGA
jgi:transcriptional regulator with XRE-family HTH domain